MIWLLSILTGLSNCSAQKLHNRWKQKCQKQKLKWLKKELTAKVTSIWLRLCMNNHMSFECLWLCECLRTSITSEGAFGIVNELVALHIGLLVEGSPTNWTCKWLQTCVGKLVSFQMMFLQQTIGEKNDKHHSKCNKWLFILTVNLSFNISNNMAKDGKTWYRQDTNWNAIHIPTPSIWTFCGNF